MPAHTHKQTNTHTHTHRHTHTDTHRHTQRHTHTHTPAHTHTHAFTHSQTPFVAVCSVSQQPKGSTSGDQKNGRVCWHQPSTESTKFSANMAIATIDSLFPMPAIPAAVCSAMAPRHCGHQAACSTIEGTKPYTTQRSYHIWIWRVACGHDK